jgi:conjugal transfer pilus assembly protein TraB
MAAERKTQQYIVLGILGAIVIGSTFAMVKVMAPNRSDLPTISNSEPNIDVTVIEDKTSAAAPEFSWVAKSRKEIDELRNIVEVLRKQLEAQKTAADERIENLRTEYDEILIQQAEKLQNMQSTNVAATADQPSSQPFEVDYSGVGSEFILRDSQNDNRHERSGQGSGSSAHSTSGTDKEASSKGFGTQFKLAAVEDEDEADVSPGRSLKNYIPAGSYAPAVVLSGADAATNVSDRENPTPVLFRITGPAITAARGKRSGRVQVTGCTVQGSAVGDLSSERVKVRLISLTCLKRNGEVIETEVSGYMVGAGKAGARGRVVSREGPQLRNAAAAGALESLGKSLQRRNSSSADDVQQATENILSEIGAGGVGKAANTLSEYYIKRAEQYQPVVTLNGGTKVELVFLEGVSLK